MSFGAPDVYYQPDNFGLEMIGIINWDDEPYQFDITAVWYHPETELFYIGSDSGCSCPGWFEDFTSLNDLEGPLTKQQVFDALNMLRSNTLSSAYRTINAAEVDGDIAEVTRKIFSI